MYVLDENKDQRYINIFILQSLHLHMLSGDHIRGHQDNRSDCCPVLEGKFEETKRVIRIRKSKKDRKHNVRKKKYKRTNNEPH